MHEHVHRLVSVVKMATVLEECNTEEQRFVVHFCGQKDSMQRILMKKCFMWTVGSVCSVKQVTTRSRYSLKGVRKSQMMKQRCGSG
jgi:Tat protein secretion system quality control protein TatD with DNase activity